MPIYEYACTGCGHHLEVMQSIKDPPLRQCPKCRKSKLQKLISAAGFQLKGTGWYATDFKGGSKKATAGDGQGANGSTEAKPSESTKGEPTTTAGNSGSGSGESSAPAKSGDTAGAASSTVPKAAAAGDARP